MHYVANAGTSVAVHTPIEFACVHVFHRSHQYPGEGLPWSHYGLNPPEKLVIETKSSGGYQHYDWI